MVNVWELKMFVEIYQIEDLVQMNFIFIVNKHMIKIKWIFLMKTNSKENFPWIFQYVCKCQDDRGRCIAMTEACDEFEHCERICKDSIHYGILKS